MRNPKIILPLTLFIFFSSVSFLSGQINLSETTDMSELPFVICRPNGEVIVAWTEGHFNGWGNILYRIYTDQTGWSNTMMAVQNERGSAAFPQMALDSKGDVHMAYMDGGGSALREIYYIKYANGRWQQREMVHYSPGLNSSWPRIDVEGNKIYVIWCQNHTAEVDPDMDIFLMEKTDGGSWPSQPQSVSMLPYSVSVHCFFDVKNGNVYSVWMDDNHEPANWNIYYNERISGAWKSSVRLAPSWNQYCPAIAVDDYEDIHVIYSDKGNPVYYMKKTSGGWTSPKVISTRATTVTTINFMKYHGGYLHAVWRQVEGEGDSIFYARGTPDGRWEAPIRVSHGGQSEYPGVDVDHLGRVHVVYSDIGVGGERDVFHVRLDNLFNQPVASFTASPIQGTPPLTVNFDASASYSPKGKIVSYSWDFGDGTSGSGVKVSHAYTGKGVFNARLTVTDDQKQSASSTRKITVGTPPVAKLTAMPKSGKSPLKVTFDASGSYDPDGMVVAYGWDFGDGTSGTGMIVTHTYTNIGSRVATLTVTDDNGLTGSASQEIVITVGPSASFTASPMKGEAPLKVDFDASASQPSQGAEKILSYEWDFGDGSGGYGKKISHTYTKFGRYKVTLEVTDDKSQTDSVTADIHAVARPKALFTSSEADGIVPLEVTYDASASSDPDGKIVSYEWDFGDGQFGQGKIATHTYTRGGDFKVALWVIDNDGYTDTAFMMLKVLDSPYPPTNVRIEEVINKGLFLSDFINIVKWANNPKNVGKVNVVKYRVYRKKKTESDAQFIFQKEISGSTFEYHDRGLGSEENMRNYTYGISAMDDKGRESERGKPDSAQSVFNESGEDKSLPVKSGIKGSS